MHQITSSLPLTQEGVNAAEFQENQLLQSAMADAQNQYMQQRIVVLSAEQKALHEEVQRLRTLCEENDVDWKLPEPEQGQEETQAGEGVNTD
jgi:hypothetical protein